MIIISLGHITITLVVNPYKELRKEQEFIPEADG